MKILVVDDSIVFRSQISASLNGVENIEVVGSAANGKIAIQKLQQFDVDLITLDMEMPEMGGLETIREMRRLGFKTKIIVFSSQTIRGAEKALEALEAGADDVIAKPSGDSLDFTKAQAMIEEALLPRINQFLTGTRKFASVPRPSLSQEKVQPKQRQKKSLRSFRPEALVIASSTGGPTALESVFSKLSSVPKVPILIVQHMPPVFTQILAKRLGELSGIPFHEASHGQKVEAGHAYVAPGGFHMLLELRGKVPHIVLNEDPLRNSVRPAADFLFERAAEIYRDRLLALVLTGMGEDGAVGASKVKDLDGGVIIQEKESCVVFGMPGAVFMNDDYDDIMNLSEISTYLKSVIA